jgi:DNA (cytosine-5)-methyltransferase 1
MVGVSPNESIARTMSRMESARFKAKAVREKIARVRAGGPVRTLDLFAGCGGLSLGFHAAGFQVAGAVELDGIAARSHARNFFPDDTGTHGQPHDITQVGPPDLVEEFGLGKSVAAAIDVVVGGPPCQAFARVGRPKLREVHNHPRAFKQDARGNLYLRYLHYVEEFQPLALLIENVPDMMNYGGHNIAEEVSEVLSGMGYVARYSLLNSAYYGVPQMRERMFLVAYHKELAADVTFPQPQNYFEIPAGYQGSRDVALKALKNCAGQKTFLDESHYVPAPAASPKLPRAVTAQEALRDLPQITLHLEGKLRKVAQRLDTLTPYSKNARLSDYAKAMRNWPGFENHVGIRDHVIRYLPRDYQIFHVMEPGDQYPQAHRHALNLFQQRLAELEMAGQKPRPGSAEYEAVKKSIVPPYDHTKFPNKWRKMEPDCPARTLMAHIGKDTYSHIHYDSEQARTISVREAARLQSFPDGFVFAGSMNAAFRQIGNAVPPLMVKAIAAEMMKALRGKKSRPARR